MRVGTLAPLDDIAQMHELVAHGFEFIEYSQTQTLNLPSELPDVPIIWQCPPDLPAEHENAHIRSAVLAAWQDHLAAAAQIGARLMVLQFRRPATLADKAALFALIEQFVELLQPITSEARSENVQIVLRNSPDNRDQLQILREIVRRVPGLGIALDIGYAHHEVVKNLASEYLWDSDLGSRILHVYASDSTGHDASLRLPPFCLGNAGISWARLVNDLRQRYNASITIDGGDAPIDYLDLSRKQWLSWWSAG